MKTTSRYLPCSPYLLLPSSPCPQAGGFPDRLVSLLMRAEQAQRPLQGSTVALNNAKCLQSMNRLSRRLIIRLDILAINLGLVGCVFKGSENSITPTRFIAMSLEFIPVAFDFDLCLLHRRLSSFGYVCLVAITCSRYFGCRIALRPSFLTDGQLLDVRGDGTLRQAIC